MADTRDLKSLEATHAGSTPALGTTSVSLDPYRAARAAAGGIRASTRGEAHRFYPRADTKRPCALL